MNFITVLSYTYKLLSNITILICVNILNICWILLDLPDKQIILPTFVENKHLYSHHLDSIGKNITDRIVCVLGFACPDITYSPAIYVLTSLLLHFMPGMIVIL